MRMTPRFLSIPLDSLFQYKKLKVYAGVLLTRYPIHKNSRNIEMKVDSLQLARSRIQVGLAIHPVILVMDNISSTAKARRANLGARTRGPSASCARKSSRRLKRRKHSSELWYHQSTWSATVFAHRTSRDMLELLGSEGEPSIS